MERPYASIFPRELVLSRGFCPTVAVFFGTFLLIHAFLRFRMRRNRPAGNLPRGLPSVPFIGSLPFMRGLDRAHVFFTEKSQEIGPVFTFHLPSRYLGRMLYLVNKCYIGTSMLFITRFWLKLSLKCNGPSLLINSFKSTRCWVRLHQWISKGEVFNNNCRFI